MKQPQVPTWDVQITGGQSSAVISNVKAYDLMDLKAGVYHRLHLEDGSILYINDFGIKSIHVRPSGSKSYSPY